MAMLNRDMTVVYYASSREDEVFESRIRSQLLETIGDIPLVSVTQKPLKGFGKNICVGDVGVSQTNCKRQLLIGVTEAKTRWIAVAEADFLYPSMYFAFNTSERSELNVYFYQPVFVLASSSDVYREKKHVSDGAVVCSRELAIQTLEASLIDKPRWVSCLEDREDKPKPFDKRNVNRVVFRGDVPAVTFKTKDAMHARCRCRAWSSDKRDLPGWGTASKLNQRFTGGIDA